jgi:hypothetical protein
MLVARSHRSGGWSSALSTVDRNPEQDAARITRHISHHHADASDRETDPQWKLQ